MKIGVQIPRNIKEVYELDSELGIPFWQQAIEKEIKNTEVAFKFLNYEERVPVGY